MVSQIRNGPHPFPAVFRRQPGRQSQARDGRDILRSGAETAFLSAAMKIHRQMQPLSHEESAAALGPVDLMPADGDQIRLPGQPDLAEALHGVAVQKSRRVFSRHDLRQLPDGHDGPGLVVDLHHAHQDGIFIDGVLCRLQIRHTGAVHTDADHVIAFLLQGPEGLQHRRMLHLGGDDAFPPAPASFCSPEEGCIVRFGAAGGEDDPVFRPSCRLFQLFSRFLQQLLGVHSHPMQ